MLSYKMDFSSCTIMPGFGKSSHIYRIMVLFVSQSNIESLCPLTSHSAYSMMCTNLMGIFHKVQCVT